MHLLSYNHFCEKKKMFFFWNPIFGPKIEDWTKNEIFDQIMAENRQIQNPELFSKIILFFVSKRFLEAFEQKFAILERFEDHSQNLQKSIYSAYPSAIDLWVKSLFVR